MTKKQTHQTEQTPDTQAPVQPPVTEEKKTENHATEEKVVIDTETQPNVDKQKPADSKPANQAKDKNGAKTDRPFNPENAAKETVSTDKPRTQGSREALHSPAAKTETVVVKKGGSGLAFLALLVALGLGAAGYYFGQQQVMQIEQKLTALEQKAGTQNNEIKLPEIPSFDQERAQIAQLEKTSRLADEKIDLLEKNLSTKEQAYAALQSQINKLSNQAAPAQPNDWLLSEADFLLTNALRKLLLDNDVDTGIALLKVADEALEKVSDPRAVNVRTAINADLKQLLSVNNVDQNTIMQRLSQLANSVDELTVLDVDFGGADTANGKISDDVADWEANMEKNAVSFLNHFIRVTPRNVKEKALLAPNQDIYLRENIRLRLQIAILAVPRQQNELYKQSLEAVASWVRSYFDTSTQDAVDFLKTLDELAEQSIYVDVPNQLNSLNVLDKILNKQPQEIQKIEISADKALTEEKPSAGEEKTAPAETDNQAPATGETQP